MSRPTIHRTFSRERPVLRVQSNGSCAELVVDTGHRLSSGRTWLAFARVPCANSYSARLLSEQIEQRLSEAVAAARREAYNEGLRAGQLGLPPPDNFGGAL
jgi:hypothetical protein